MIEEERLPKIVGAGNVMYEQTALDEYSKVTNETVRRAFLG